MFFCFITANDFTPVSFDVDEKQTHTPFAFLQLILFFVKLYLTLADN